MNGGMSDKEFIDHLLKEIEEWKGLAHTSTDLLQESLAKEKSYDWEARVKSHIMTLENAIRRP